MFSKLGIAEKLVDKTTAVLMFNNRGHDKVAFVARIGKNHHTEIRGGAAHEVFTDCVDDIQGAINLARKQGVKRIYLAGHSTGCQKSMYWAAKKKQRTVRGIILLAPISDLSAGTVVAGKRQIARAEKIALSLVKNGRKHDLLPTSVWSWPLLADAQRFLSLYTPDSIEEMFSYTQPKKNPRIFKSVRIPLLAIFAGEDEFADRPAQKIVEWFKKHSRSKGFKTVTIPGVHHGFKGAERTVAKTIQKFINS